MPKRADGSIVQSGLRFEQDDFAHEFISYPVLGVVLNVYCSDDRLNAESRTFQDLRGTQCQARVLVINDGKDIPWLIPNAVITPSSSSGFDNFSEEMPRGTTGTIDGTKFDWNLLDIPAFKMNGDWCIVNFLGGSINMPFIASWWPHPANRRDPTTDGEGNLLQGRRWVKRFQGTQFSVTSQGDVFIDTNNAGSEFADGQRKKVIDGGEIDVAVKDTQRVQVNFNPPVAMKDSKTGEIYVGHPDVLQPNPAPKADERQDLLTRLFMDKDFITAVAGRVIQLRGNNDGESNADTVLLGETPTDHLVKGEKHQITFNDLVAKVNAFEEAHENHIHAGGSGNTSKPIAPGTSESSYANQCHLIIDPLNPAFTPCTAAGLTAVVGGDPFIPDPIDVAAHNAIFGPGSATVPPAADGIQRVVPMPDDDLSDVAKTE